MSNIKVIKYDLWSLYDEGNAIAITTNGFIKKNGECVMGAGCAKQCKNRYSWFPKYLGELIEKNGNHVFRIGNIFTLPVKHNWYEKADIDLILESLIELQEMLREDETVFVPLPGCGNGKLKWEDVSKEIENLPLNNITFVTNEGLYE